MAKQNHASAPHFPRNVSRRILERAARGERRIVLVIDKDGRPTRVFGFDEYLARQELTKTVQPWRSRKGTSAESDPLGAIEGAPVGPLTRDQIYED
jgi:hypothetical protein